MRLPSLRGLRTFRTAARHLSFKQAGDELSITASAVSHQIRNLESYLGLPLFRRLPRSLELTEAGEKYFAFLDTMFSRLEAETHQLRTEYGRRIVRLCVPSFFAEEAILPRLHAFEEMAGSTDIRVTTQSSTENDPPAEADVSILLNVPLRQGLETHRLFERKVVVACSQSYLADNPIRTYDDLDGKTLLVHDRLPNAWVAWAKAVGAKPPTPKRLLRSDSMSAIVRAAQQGLGVALISWPLGRNCFGNGMLTRVFDEEVPTGKHFFVTVRVEDANREDVTMLRNWIVTEFGDWA